MTRAILLWVTVGILAAAGFSQAAKPAPKMNLLIITTDDMSADSVGAFGGKLQGLTPHMDALAASGMRFERAHVVVGNCMPSRNVMWSGRYPHNNGVDSFNSLSKDDVKYPVLGDLMKAGGWFTGIRHKVSHSTPYMPFPWDIVLDLEAAGKKADVKNPATYGPSLAQGMAAAKTEGKPFCLMLNVADPHKPFYAEGKGGKTVPDKNEPSRVISPEELPVPGFLPDDPIVRKELSHYYSSVRRADDAVGSILQALKESGHEEDTLVIFLSDHGMPLPFAKTQLYHHSTCTPLIVRWPGVTKPGSVDADHLVSTVDLLPTLLDALGQPLPDGLDGRSFVPLLKGQEQSGRDMVFKSFHENSGGQRTPMRAVQTKDWLYIFNPWSDGIRVMSGATVGTSTCRQMRVLARTDAAIAARIDLFDHRRPEEAYEVRYDPDALTNLVDSPAHAEQVAQLEKALEDWMKRVNDPLLEVFQKRRDTAFVAAYMDKLESNATRRKDRITNNRQKMIEGGERPNKKAAKKKATAETANLIRLEPLETITAGKSITVKVAHTLSADLGQQDLHITLKSGTGQRLERQTVKVSGTGVAEATFTIPTVEKVSFAALLGPDYNHALQHLTTPAVKVGD